MENLIVEVRPLEDAGNIKASVTVSVNTDLGMLTIRQFKVVQKPGSEPWIAYPQVSFLKDGNTNYRNILEVPWPMKKKIEEEVFNALKTK